MRVRVAAARRARAPSRAQPVWARAAAPDSLASSLVDAQRARLALHDEPEVIVAPVSDVCVRIGDRFVGPRDGTKFAIAITRAEGSTSHDDVKFAEHVAKEAELSIRDIRKRELCAEVRMHARQVSSCRGLEDGLEPFRAVHKAADGAQQCLPGCSLYVGLLEAGGNLIKFAACNEASNMKGQRLFRGAGVSFDAVAKPEKVLVVSHHSAPELRERVRRAPAWRRKPRTTSGPRPPPSVGKWPFMCAPLRTASTQRRSACSELMVSTTSPNRAMESPRMASSRSSSTWAALGRAIDSRRKHDAVQRLRGLLDEPLVSMRNLREALLALVTGNLLFSSSAEIWHLDESWGLRVVAQSLAAGDPNALHALRCARVEVEVKGINGQSLGKHNLQTVLICGKRRYKTSILKKARVAQWTEPPELKMHMSMTSMRAEVYHCDGKETREGACCWRAPKCPSHSSVTARPEIPRTADGRGRAHPARRRVGTPLDEEETNMIEVPVRIVRARDLAKTDTFGLSDPYCMVKWRDAGTAKPRSSGAPRPSRTRSIRFGRRPCSRSRCPTREAGCPCRVGGGRRRGRGRRAARARAKARPARRRQRRGRRDDGNSEDNDVDETLNTDREDELLIEVWDEDPFGLGDFLGQTVLPASTLRAAMPSAVREEASRPRSPSAPSSSWRNRKRMTAPKTKGQEYVQGPLTLILGPAALKWRPGAPMNSAPICDLSSGARPRETSVRLMIVKANGLANADMLGKSDPFVVVTWRGEQVLKTKTVSDTLDPVWTKEEVVLTVPGAHRWCGAGRRRDRRGAGDPDDADRIVRRGSHEFNFHGRGFLEHRKSSCTRRGTTSRVRSASKKRTSDETDKRNRPSVVQGNHHFVVFRTDAAPELESPRTAARRGGHAGRAAARGHVRG